VTAVSLEDGKRRAEEGLDTEGTSVSSQFIYKRYSEKDRTSSSSAQIVGRLIEVFTSREWRTVSYALPRAVGAMNPGGNGLALSHLDPRGSCNQP
jgi:hypothetical protein